MFIFDSVLVLYFWPFILVLYFYGQQAIWVDDKIIFFKLAALTQAHNYMLYNFWPKKIS